MSLKKRLYKKRQRRDTGIRGYRDTGIQGYRDTEIQGYKKDYLKKKYSFFFNNKKNKKGYKKCFF